MEVTVPVERTLTRLDHVRLSRLLADATGPAAFGLQELLDANEPVASALIAPTVVTMRSQLLLEDAAGGAPMQLTLCYPAEADPAHGRVSVLSPVGSAVLGLRLGELARWRTPDGQAHAARIVDLLFQPEASGEYAE